MDSTIPPQNVVDDRGLKIRQSFLKYPGESPEVDYKSGVLFVKGNDFSLKLVKHILGMANGGGGYIVIGYPEAANGHPEASPVTDEVLSTYDVSNLAACVEKYKAGTEKIDILVHKDKHPETEQVYPIIEVGSFKMSPFFCKSSAGKILEQNALYIRTAGARTIRVASPDEWEQLIKICVEKRQGEMVKRLGGLMRDIGLAIPSQSESVGVAKKMIEKWREEVRADAMEAAKKAGFKFEGWEITHSFLIERAEKFDVKQLLQAMTSSTLKNTGWPIGYVFNVPDLKPSPYKHGLRAVVSPGNRDSFDYWFLDENGNFYYFRSFEEDLVGASQSRVAYPSLPERQVWFDTAVWRVAECLEHTVALSKALGIVDTEKFEIRLSYWGIQGRSLLDSPGGRRHLRARATDAENYVWEMNVSVDSLNFSMDQIIKKVTRNLFILFDFTELSDEIIQGIINEYRESRIK